MSYSYWCSHLNPTIYIGQVISTPPLKCYPQVLSQNDISLAYLSSLKFPLINRSSFKPSKWWTTLSYFRSLFNDHRRPFVYYVERVYYVQYLNMLKNFFCYLNTEYLSSPMSFKQHYKDTKTFSNFQVFIIFFLVLECPAFFPTG